MMAPSRKHRHVRVGVIEHLNFSPVFVETMETTDVLFQRPPPGNGHREKQSTQPGIVEPFARIAAGG